MEKDVLGLAHYNGYYLVYTNEKIGSKGLFFNPTTNTYFITDTQVEELKDLPLTFAMSEIFRLRNRHFQSGDKVIITRGRSFKSQEKVFDHSDYVLVNELYNIERRYAYFADGTSCPFKYLVSVGEEDIEEPSRVFFEEVKK